MSHLSRLGSEYQNFNPVSNPIRSPNWNELKPIEKYEKFLRETPIAVLNDFSDSTEF